MQSWTPKEKRETPGKSIQVQDGTVRVGVVLSVYIFNYIGVSVMYHEADVHTALVSAIIVTLPVDALARFNQQRDASRHIDYFPLFQHLSFDKRFHPSP